MSFLGGSQSSETKVPGYIQDWQKQVMGLMQMAGQQAPPIIGGAMVAGESPGQRAAAQGANAWAQAAGMPMMSPQEYMPPAQEFAGGVKGHSALPGLMQNMDMMNQNFPGANDPLYQMFPSLAPEGYEMGQGGSPWGQQGMDQNGLMALLQALGLIDPEGNMNMDGYGGPGDPDQGAGIGHPSDFFGEDSKFGQALAALGAAIGGSAGAGMGDISAGAGNMSGADAAGIGISGPDAGIGLGPDGGVAW